MLRFIPGVLLLLLSIAFLLTFVQAVLTDQAVLGQFLVLALMLGVLWFLYMKLPGFVRRGIGKGIRRIRGKGTERR